MSRRFQSLQAVAKSAVGEATKQELLFAWRAWLSTLAVATSQRHERARWSHLAGRMAQRALWLAKKAALEELLEKEGKRKA